MAASSSQEETIADRPNADWWYKRAAVVYFFGAGDPPTAIKIGVTTIPKERDRLEEAHWLACIRQRHKQIQSSNHETVKLLGVIRFFEGSWPALAAEKCERELHKKFAELQRFKAHTCGAEWFTPGKALWDFIKETETPPGYPGIIGVPINR